VVEVTPCCGNGATGEAAVPVPVAHTATQSLAGAVGASAVRSPVGRPGRAFFEADPGVRVPEKGDDVLGQ
jgi:hypothetical protein